MESSPVALAILKACAGCGESFETTYPEKVYCTRACGRAKKQRDRRKRHMVEPAKKSDILLKARARNKKYYDKHFRAEPRTPKEKDKSPRVAVCACGEVFLTTNKNVKYCPACRANRTSLLDAVRCGAQRARARALGLAADFKPRDWRKAKTYFGNRCAYCGGEGDLHQDHFMPVALGGGYTRKNIVPACPTCNHKKKDKNPADWLPAGKYQEISLYLAGAQ